MNNPIHEEPHVGADTKTKTVDRLTLLSLLTMLAAFGLGLAFPKQLQLAATLTWAVMTVALIVLVLLWGKKDSDDWPYPATVTALLLTIEGASAGIVCLANLRTYNPYTFAMDNMMVTIFFGIIASGLFIGVFTKRLFDVIKPAKEEEWEDAYHIPDAYMAKGLAVILLVFAPVSTFALPCFFFAEEIPLITTLLAIIGITVAIWDYAIYKAAPLLLDTSLLSFVRAVCFYLVNAGAIALTKGLFIDFPRFHEIYGSIVAILFIAFAILIVITIIGATICQILRAIFVTTNAESEVEPEQEEQEEQDEPGETETLDEPEDAI